MTYSSLVIREASLAEAAAVAEILQEFNGGTVDEQTAAARLEAIKATETVLLAFVEGAAVGLCSVRVQPFLSEDHPYAEVTELYVRPEHRGKGIAKGLMERAEALALGRGATEVILLTGFKNADAQALYRRIGYGDYALAMRKKLQ